MPQLSALDPIIAFVAVLLLLSLLAQAIQGLVKQLFRFKSRQLEASLVDLFEVALGGTNVGRATTWGGASLRQVGRLANQATPASQALVAEVLRQFRQVGRLTMRAGNALESLAKEDLLKVVGRVAPESLLPGLADHIQNACRAAAALRQAIEAVRTADLPAEASAAYARTRDALSPILADLASLQRDDIVRSDLLIADVLRLRDVSLADVLQLLGEVQRLVGEQLPADGAPPAHLSQLDAALKEVVAAIVAMQAKVDAALSPLRSRLAAIEGWYDTVMQGFEERYQRSIRGWTFAVSLLVVVAVDANPLEIYRSASDPARLDSYLELAETLVKLPQEPEPEAGSRPAATAAAQPTPEATPPAELLDAIRKEQAKIAARLETATTLGLGFDPGRVGKRIKAGDYGLGLFLTLLSWLTMAVLVWLGAPFWHDVLEALFGVKQLVGKKASVRNVEQKSGAGNPKP